MPARSQLRRGQQYRADRGKLHLQKSRKNFSLSSTRVMQHLWIYLDINAQHNRHTVDIRNHELEYRSRLLLYSTDIVLLSVLPAAISTDALLTSYLAPIHKRISLNIITKQINASLLPDVSNPSHVYRLSPSPDVDKAWDRITQIGIHGISSDDVLRLNKDPKASIQPPPDWDFGQDTPYMAEIDVFHQLHCLNALRKALVINYEYYWGAKWGFEPPLMFTTHLEHCMDILRQNIMCHADVDAITVRTNIFPKCNFHRLIWSSTIGWLARTSHFQTLQYTKSVVISTHCLSGKRERP